MTKRIVLLVIGAALMSAPAFAEELWGTCPEFDTVGCDYSNIFNDQVRMMVADATTDINKSGDWSLIPEDPNDPFVLREYFTAPSMLSEDPCFNTLSDSDTPSYKSALIDAYNGDMSWEWQIVLQMRPESDIDMVIQSCVLNHEGPPEMLHYAYSTGSYRAWGGTYEVCTLNPQITIQAIPGKFASQSFKTHGPFTLSGRKMPELGLCLLDGALYVTKGCWDQHVTIDLPRDGDKNVDGSEVFSLTAGDMIRVTVYVPKGGLNSDLRYGAQNVFLQYNGTADMHCYNDSICTAP
jgi:hypothetical protein